MWNANSDGLTYDVKIRSGTTVLTSYIEFWRQAWNFDKKCQKKEDFGIQRQNLTLQICLYTLTLEFICNFLNPPTVPWGVETSQTELGSPDWPGILELGLLVHLQWPVAWKVTKEWPRRPHFGQLQQTLHESPGGIGHGKKFTKLLWFSDNPHF